MSVEFSRQIFEKYSNIKFHENPFSGSRVVACGRTDGQTDMTKLIITFRHFAQAPDYRFLVFIITVIILRQAIFETLNFLPFKPTYRIFTILHCYYLIKFTCLYFIRILAFEATGVRFERTRVLLCRTDIA
jgi:hypothetical protein